MPPNKKKINVKKGKKNSGVQSKAQKQVKNNVVSETDESDESEDSLSEIEEALKKTVGNPARKMVISRDPMSEDFKYNVQNYCSGDEDIIEIKHMKSVKHLKTNTAEESVELHNSMRNLKISTPKSSITKSRCSSVDVKTKDLQPKLPKAVIKLAKDLKSQQTYTYSLQTSFEERTCPPLSPKKKDLNLTPARQTRRSSASSQLISDSQTPGRTYSSKKTPSNTNSVTPSKRERHLRERNIVNYREVSPPANETRKEVKRDSAEIGLTETPRKKGRSQKIGLPSVDEESNENDPSKVHGSPEEFSPKSELSTIRRSTRGRKTISEIDSDFIYEGSPKKRRNTTATTPSTRNQTPSRRGTPGRKRLITPERNTVDSPSKNITATPKGRTPRRSTLTPSMHQRNVNVSKPTTRFQEFRSRLHVSFVPKSLPCREAEFNNIFTFLRGKLAEETGGCIYISGVPGTGKTATVNEVISCLKKLESRGELPSFKFININGMKLTEPRQAYVQIHKSFTGITTSYEEAHRCLHQRFTAPASKRDMTLLLIDEMDLLCTKRQDVVYNLLDWPTHKSSCLVVITIANTMDLPERVLMGRVTSRLGLTRLTFQPYNHMQLKEIIKTRLKDSDAFKSEAIEFVARKVDSVSGDARRALDICRRATEIAESNKENLVTMKNVTSALEEMIANPRVRAIKSCSLLERKFLEAVCSEVLRTGVEQVTLKNTYKQFDTLCLIEGEEVPNITQVLEICRKLASWRLILWESGADLYQSIMLNVSTDNIYFSKQRIS